MSDFLAMDYVDALRDNYPAVKTDSVDEVFHIGIVRELLAYEKHAEVELAGRFVPLHERRFTSRKNAREITAVDDLRRGGASLAYKGLLHLKPPVDLVLYSNLIWELQPRTIIELGALQGGSALWFADQLDALSPEGQVHSFELFDKCIHPTAKHPRLHFHHADLRDLTTIGQSFVRDLPHPWLVVDDAHENWNQVIPFFGKLMAPGDYYVFEDVFSNDEFIQSTPSGIQLAVKLARMLDFKVDTKYTDAFGYNVTCSPNGWWRKSS